jgi:four helix bundle protein
MARIERFEDIDAWILARQLTRETYRLTEGRAVARDLRFVGQLRAASVSVMSNIAEGFERDSLPQFAQALNVARGSCAEVRSLLYVALDAGYIDERTLDRLQGLGKRTRGAISPLKASVERRHQEDQGGNVREDPAIGYDSEAVPFSGERPSAPSTQHPAPQETA